MPRKFDESKRQRTRRNTPFDEKYERITESGCWIWTAGTTSGYGEHGGKLAHRVSYERAKGKLPPGMFACHTCDVRCCVNPDHLYAGTVKDNSKDAVERKRHAFGERAGGNKLTIEQVKQIIESPLSGRQIAIKFGVTRSLASAIRRGERWKLALEIAS